MPVDMIKSQRLGWLTAIFMGLRLVDLLVVAASGVAAYWIRYGLGMPPRDEIIAIALGMMLCLLVFNLGQAYVTGYAESVWAMTVRALGYWLLVFLFLLAAAFMLKVSARFSRLWVGLWVLTSGMGFVVARIVVARIVVRAHRLGRLSMRVGIIGADDLGTQLYQHLMAHDDYVQVLGVFDDRMDRLREQAEANGIEIKGRIADIIPWAAEQQIDCIVIALPWSSERRLRELIEMLQGLAVDVQICPEGLGFVVRSFPLFRNSIATTLGGLPMFTIGRRPLDGWDWLIKRIEDTLLIALVAPLVLPLCLLIALAVKLDSRGPALFRQARRGFNGRNFMVYKFRSMKVEDCQPEGRTDAARRDDPRVTRVGRFLRRTSLDELPQILNVVRGEMSIIGPRPHALSHDEQFARIIREYYARHRVLPGITGWAQVNGLRGSVEDEEHIRRRVDYDLWYIENWSILLDLRILLMTPFVGLIHRNAY